MTTQQVKVVAIQLLSPLSDLRLLWCNHKERITHLSNL